ncbi:hypothetical protein M433DRAFT_197184 [Acidomyces richmondensis BFW]|nr:MAG: hypothetical protein FE78DRAFT_348991 [Acidomyces sp. 'richmondensis']KYG46555.1 hypothetical protein M433DRAFT_197184 [Acidomyces richmondensis BFW]
MGGNLRRDGRRRWWTRCVYSCRLTTLSGCETGGSRGPPHDPGEAGAADWSGRPELRTTPHLVECCCGCRLGIHNFACIWTCATNPAAEEDGWMGTGVLETIRRLWPSVQSAGHITMDGVLGSSRREEITYMSVLRRFNTCLCREDRILVCVVRCPIHCCLMRHCS